MKISVLASGSKGNCAYVETENCHILIDIGMSCNYVEEKLRELNIEPNAINAILISHTHSDHINGLLRFYQKYRPKVYITPKMLPALEKILDDFDCCYFDNDVTNIGDMSISIIKTSHDVEDSVGFIINEELVYITDTGYLNSKYFKHLENKKMYVLESNHDLEMIIDGHYPYHLKQRILSDRGHLSNHDASIYLAKLVGPDTKRIILAHLSEENNNPEKALNTLLEYVDTSKMTEVAVASQKERTELIEI